MDSNNIPLPQENILQILQEAGMRPEQVGGGSAMLRMLEQELWNCFPKITRFIEPYNTEVAGLAKDSWRYRRVLRAHLTVLLRLIASVSLEDSVFVAQDIVGCEQLRKTYTSTVGYEGNLFEAFEFGLWDEYDNTLFEISVLDISLLDVDPSAENPPEDFPNLDIDSNLPSAFIVTKVTQSTSWYLGTGETTVIVDFTPANLDDAALANYALWYYMHTGMRKILGESHK